MLVPLHGFVRGDTLGLVVLVQDRHTIAHLAASLMRAAATRVPPAARVAVYAGGRRLDPQLTVLQAGLEPLDRVDVVPEGGDGP